MQIDFLSDQSEREKSGKERQQQGGGRRREKVCSLQMISMQGPGSGAAPSVGGVCELADDGAAQMGSSLARSSLLCTDPAL